jgi:hypothetical protein
LNLIAVVCIAFILVRSRKGAKLPPPQLDKTASELLADLLNGGAVAVTQIIDPASMFMVSPKDRG